MTKRDPSGSIQIRPAFFPQARALRDYFAGLYEDPKQADGCRFVWDYWHVPGQYTQLRTPAYEFFPPALYRKFHEHLVMFGRETLGCWDVTPTWLSAYVEGCKQELHADVPHGPWAFVYSLTPWETRSFSGGETLLLKPETLNYWAAFESFQGVESADLLRKIPARFNQLLVFDPRIPHGVTEVRGTHDPRQARLVIHGWFTNPQPFVKGPLGRASATRILNEFLSAADDLFARHPDVHGTLSARLSVSTTGRVTAVRVLTATLQSLSGEKGPALELIRALLSRLKALRFPKASGASQITVPLLYRF